MIVLAVLTTAVAAMWSMVVMFANGMRSSPGPFEGGLSISIVWMSLTISGATAGWGGWICDVAGTAWIAASAEI